MKIEECFTSILDFIVIDKSGPFVKIFPQIGEPTTYLQLVNENHLLDLIEEKKLSKDKLQSLFSFHIQVIETSQLLSIFNLKEYLFKS